MKITTQLFERLKKYSEFQKKVHMQDDPSQTDETRMQRVQQEWLEGKGINYVLKEAQHLHVQPLDASTGSSGFKPPVEVEKKLATIKSADLVDYVHHLPDKKFVQAAKAYFQSIGVLDKQTSLGSDIYDKDEFDLYTMYGHGTTELFASALKYLIKTPGDTIIVTNPTYGLFVPIISQEQAQVVAFNLNSQNNYKPDPKALVNLIQKTNKEHKIAYLEEIKVLVQVFQQLIQKRKITTLTTLSTLIESQLSSCDFSDIDKQTHAYNSAMEALVEEIVPKAQQQLWKNKLHLSLCPRVRGYFHTNPHMPLGTILDQNEINALAKALAPFSDLTVIDDLTYYELILDDKKKPGTFARSDLIHRTLTLYSISKQFALAAIRAGLALGPYALMKAIAQDIFNRVNMPSIYCQKALYNILTLEEKTREKYLSEINTEYCFRKSLTIALTLGISHVSNPQHVKKIKETLSNLKLSPQEVVDMLQGIKGISLVTDPKAGFFVLLDFSEFKGKYLGQTQLNTSMDFRNAFYCLTDVNTIPGEMNFHFGKPILRYSFSLMPEDIAESFLRMRSILSVCTNKPLEQPKPKARQPLNDTPLNTAKSTHSQALLWQKTTLEVNPSIYIRKNSKKRKIKLSSRYI